MRKAIILTLVTAALAWLTSAVAYGGNNGTASAAEVRIEAAEPAAVSRPAKNRSSTSR